LQRQKRNRNLRKKQIQKQKQRKIDLVYQMYQTIHHNFPEIFDWMSKIDDCRKKSHYQLTAVLTACLAMYLFKCGSRNAMTDLHDDEQFKENYTKIFKLPLPHPDTTDNVIKKLDNAQIEQLKVKMIDTLIRRKVFYNQRFRGQWYPVAIDATGAASFKHKHCSQCLSQTSKKGKTTYSHKVVEAHLVTYNGFSISLATEWIENPADEKYNKQDCERKAFIRIAEKIKKAFPKLPIVILADGLYPYEGFFAVCKANKWGFIVTFKEGNLPTVWRKVNEQRNQQVANKQYEKLKKPDGSIEERHYRWVNKIDYHGYDLNYLECDEIIIYSSSKEKESIKYKRFVHITNLPLNTQNIKKSSRTGRLRWKIENEGFNTLKNGGYCMKHKYSRTSYLAMKNDHQFMQMASLINQLMVKTVKFQNTYLRGKNHKTLKRLWKDLVAVMQWIALETARFETISMSRIQYRFVT